MQGLVLAEVRLDLLRNLLLQRRLPARQQANPAKIVWGRISGTFPPAVAHRLLFDLKVPCSGDSVIQD